ncbi:hypothetical protein [Yoonia sp.]|uniref:hypothetical protein n=1 Tax=Yoonia sp. TaxID=2212373 RepID=UPI002E063FDF|nr:hypothetical protein [Yoonia sp.]
MAIGSFVNGMVRGAGIRDTMDNNKRTRAMEDTRFEREGQKFEMDQERHKLAMERARRAGSNSGKSRYTSEELALMSDVLLDGPSGSAQPAANGGQGGSGYTIMPLVQNQPLSYGASEQPQPTNPAPPPATPASMPIETSALGALPNRGQPKRFRYDGQTLIPEGSFA